MRQDLFVINVSKSDGLDWTGQRMTYRHHFRIETDSTIEAVGWAFYDEIKALYPKPDYKVSLTKWEYRGRNMADETGEDRPDAS